jgi:hypothetical protein
MSIFHILYFVYITILLIVRLLPIPIFSWVLIILNKTTKYETNNCGCLIPDERKN